jgi:dTDP-4-dehydrorhamnose reductase
MNKKQMIGVTGYSGNLGSRLIKMNGCEPLRCNILDSKEVREELYRVNPDVVLHLAAETRVDYCEQHYEDALAVNMHGTALVCEWAEKIIGAGRVAVLSSDHVFNGEKGFYSEGDEPDPINNYGMSKLGTESVAKLYGDRIVRLSRCFDSKSKDINEYLEAVKRGEDIFVPDHMRKSYAHMDFVAESLYQYAMRFDEMPEILHVSGDVNLSFYELMCYIVAEMNYEKRGSVWYRGDELGHAPRPFLAGLNPALSHKLGLPNISISSSVKRLCNEL